MPENSGMTVHCPKCDSTEIREKNVAYANLDVLDWEWDEEAGQPHPTDYDTGADAEWECSDARLQYICAMCDWEGNLHNLVVRGR